MLRLEFFINEFFLLEYNGCDLVAIVKKAHVLRPMRKCTLNCIIDFQKPLLSAEYGKLNVMRWHLTKAESAARKGD